MRLLDAYLVSAVAKLYVAGQMAFFATYVCIDLVERIFKVKPPEGVSRLVYLVQIYTSQFPSIFETTAPFVFVLVCLVVLARFHHKSQLVAINAAGISMSRLLSSLMVFAVVLGCVIFACGEWLTPQITKLRLSISDPTLKLLSQKHINFRDELQLESQELAKTLGFKSSEAMIDMRSLDTSAKSGVGFHVTFMDQDDRPKAKLFAKAFKWNDEGLMELESAKILPYAKGTALQAYPSALIRLNIPLEKVTLALKTFDALSYDDLEYFRNNLRFRTEQLYRWVVPTYPLLMLLVSCACALPLIYKKPVYAYFVSLGCSFGVFFVSGFFRSSMETNDIAPSVSLPILFSGCIGLFFLRFKSIPS